MVAALDDDEHEAAQRERYARRREVLLAAFASAGFTIEHSVAGLYLWATRDEPGRETVDWLAQRGILAETLDFGALQVFAARPVFNFIHNTVRNDF